MNFEFNEEQKMLKESMHRWFQDNYSFDQRRVILDSDDGFSREHWQTFAELGWLSIPFSEEHGGFGGNVIDSAAIMEEFGKALTLEPVVPTLILFGGILQASSNTELVGKSISSLIEGNLLGALANYEPQSRFDLSNVACEAKKDGDNYVINGQKSLVLGGGHADQFVLVARTSGAQTDENGISLFLVDRETAGLTINSYKMMDGQKVAELTFNDVKLGADTLLAAQDEGFALLAKVIQEAHVVLSAEALGIMQELNTTTVEYTKTRKQFGLPISSFQVLQHRMVDTFMAYEQTKSLLYGTLCELTDDAIDQEQGTKMVNALRTLLAKYGKLVADEAVQLHGGMGLTDELSVGHYVKRIMMINLMFGSGDFFQKQFNELAYN